MILLLTLHFIFSLDIKSVLFRFNDDYKFVVE